MSANAQPQFEPTVRSIMFVLGFQSSKECYTGVEICQKTRASVAQKIPILLPAYHHLGIFGERYLEEHLQAILALKEKNTRTLDVLYMALEAWLEYLLDDAKDIREFESNLRYFQDLHRR